MEEIMIFIGRLNLDKISEKINKEGGSFFYLKKFGKIENTDCYEIDFSRMGMTRNVNDK